MALVEDELLSEGLHIGGIGELITQPTQLADGRLVTPATARMHGVFKVSEGGIYQIRRRTLNEVLTIQVDHVEIDSECQTTDLDFRICDKQTLDQNSTPA